MEEALLTWMQKLSKQIAGLDTKLDTIITKGFQIKEDKLLDNQDLYFLFKVSRPTLQRYRIAGLLPYTRINRRNYYLESDVQDFLINYFDKNGHVDDKTKFKKKSRIKVPLDTEKSL